MDKKVTLKSFVSIVLLAWFFAFTGQLQAGDVANPAFDQQVEQWWKEFYQRGQEKNLDLRLDALGLLEQDLRTSLEKDNLDADRSAMTNQILYLTLQAQAKYAEAKIAFDRYIDLLQISKGDDYVFQVIRRNAYKFILKADIDNAKWFLDKGVECLKDHPQINELYVLTGRYYQRVENWQQSRFYLEKVINSPGKADRTVQLAMVKMVTTLAHENKFDEAHQMLDRLVAIDSSWEAYAEAQHGRLYLSKGMYTDALFKFNNVQSKYSTSRYASMVRGELDYVREAIVGADPSQN